MGVHVRTCRDAPPHPWLVESTYLVTPNPHTKFEHNRPSRSWDTEARSARAHVQRYHIRDYCISCNLWVPKCIPNFNEIGPTVTKKQQAEHLWKRGAHVRTCRCTPSMTCGRHLVNDPQPTYQIWTQSAKSFQRYRSAVCGPAAHTQIFSVYQ